MIGWGSNVSLQACQLPWQAKVALSFPLKPPEDPGMTTYFITRHPGAIEWAARQGIAVDVCLKHLDNLCMLQSGDTVAGILPVNLAAEVCARGVRYLHLSLELPPEARGRELTAGEMTVYGARLEEFMVRPVLRV